MNLKDARRLWKAIYDEKQEEKVMIVPEYYEDLSVLHDGTMMPRAYYVPASKRMNDPVECREDSDRMQMLNGNWKFRYYNSIYDVQDTIRRSLTG